MVADFHLAHVEYDAIEVEENARSKMYVCTVVAVERRLHPHGVASRTKKLDQDRPALLLLSLARVVEGLTQISCALACPNEFGSSGLYGSPASIFSRSDGITYLQPNAERSAARLSRHAR